MRTKDKIYEIRLGKTESVIIQNAQGEFMSKVFDLARESFLEGEELEIVWTNADDDIEHNDIGVIFHQVTPRESEWDVSHDLGARRWANGSVMITIGSWSERSDKTGIDYLLTADEADRLGRALCCVEGDTFDGLADRAKKFGGI